MRLALYQPDIPQNAGALMRLAACFGVELDLIEPCGFVIDDRRMGRSAMDYRQHLTLHRHVSWDAFLAARKEAGRLVLLTTRATTRHVDFAFAPSDTLLLGRESAGVPDEVHAQVDASVVIRLRPDVRSLNVAQAGAIVLAEALRQTGGLP
ncbi:tRNA (cytidine(34)-2'-O)-methyltransferase [Roseiterribacter gracilis]|uniref:tRNA (cytidine(34)-2'-O)-methyltransferase n=1 Tax=Roseiterribacter gracilis TaxID=2812848 RepID=A0A8S8X8L4_9PROT|nr:tRNA (cytidine(34)-2'-O)-methyltransferase [Rhodospirillales bacterium TMPK1]